MPSKTQTFWKVCAWCCQTARTSGLCAAGTSLKNPKRGSKRQKVLWCRRSGCRDSHSVSTRSAGALGSFPHPLQTKPSATVRQAEPVNAGASQAGRCLSLRCKSKIKAYSARQDCRSQKKKIEFKSEIGAMVMKAKFTNSTLMCHIAPSQVRYFLENDTL